MHGAGTAEEEKAEIQPVGPPVLFHRVHHPGEPLGRGREVLGTGVLGCADTGEIGRMQWGAMAQGVGEFISSLSPGCYTRPLVPGVHTGASQVSLSLLWAELVLGNHAVYQTLPL